MQSLKGEGSILSTSINKLHVYFNHHQEIFHCPWTAGAKSPQPTNYLPNFGLCPLIQLFPEQKQKNKKKKAAVDQNPTSIAIITQEALYSMFLC